MQKEMCIDFGWGDNMAQSMDEDIKKIACMITELDGLAYSTYKPNDYVVTATEVKQLEKEHITEAVYCNEYRCCSLSWFYSSIGYELVQDDIEVVDDELIKKAAVLVGYECDKDFAEGMSDVIENNIEGQDKFIASLVLAKEIARTMNGRAVLMCD